MCVCVCVAEEDLRASLPREVMIFSCCCCTRFSAYLCVTQSGRNISATRREDHHCPIPCPACFRPQPAALAGALRAAACEKSGPSSADEYDFYFLCLASRMSFPSFFFIAVENLLGVVGRKREDSSSSSRRRKKTCVCLLTCLTHTQRAHKRP